MNDKLRTLQSLVETWASRGERTAILALNKESSRRWSFRELAARAASLAGGLRAAGLEYDDPVAVLAEPQPEWFAAALATLRAGGVVVPLDVQLSDDNLRRILENSGARWLFTTTAQTERLEELGLAKGRQIVLLDAGDDDDQSWKQLLGDKDAEHEPVDADDRAVLFYTSGTTGPPKGVPLSHGNIAFQISTLLDENLLREEDRVLLPLPAHHVYPFVFGTLFPLVAGCPVVLPYSRTGPQMVRALKQGSVTTIIGVPRLYRALVEGLEARARSQGRLAGVAFGAGLALSGAAERYLGARVGKQLLRPIHAQFGPDLRLMASGGSALDPVLDRKLKNLGWQLADGYGLTETSPLLTWNSPHESKSGTVGKPLRGVTLRIDNSGGGSGEVLARGPGIFGGYHDRPEATEAVFTGDGWFRTGDLGYFDDEGFLHLEGRAGTLIVTEGGENVQPDEVEEVYAAHPAIKEIGVFEREGGVVGIIVPDAGAVREQGGDATQAVRKAVDERARQLASYQRLGDYAVTRSALDRTRLGDLRRHKLEARYEEAKQSEGIPEGPMALSEMQSDDRALIEQHSAARRTWGWLTERYPDAPLAPDTSPQLDLGIDSIEWISVTLEISRQTGARLDEDAIGRIETVRDLLREVTEAKESEGNAPDPLTHPEQVLSVRQKKWLTPLSPAQKATARGLFALNRAFARGLFRLRVDGRERLPREGPFIIAPNHLSYLDPFMIAAALGNDQLRQTYWAGYTGAAFGNPVFRFGSRLAQAVPVDAQGGVLSSLAFGAAVLQRKKRLVWFPEGERSDTGELLPFQPGIGMLLERFEVPVVPTCIRGTHAAMPPGAALPRPHPVRVTFGEAMDPREVKRSEDEERADRIVQALWECVAAMIGGEAY